MLHHENNNRFSARNKLFRPFSYFVGTLLDIYSGQSRREGIHNTASRGSSSSLSWTLRWMCFSMLGTKADPANHNNNPFAKIMKWTKRTDRFSYPFKYIRWMVNFRSKLNIHHFAGFSPSTFRTRGNDGSGCRSASLRVNHIHHQHHQLCRSRSLAPLAPPTTTDDVISIRATFIRLACRPPVSRSATHLLFLRIPSPIPGTK